MYYLSIAADQGHMGLQEFEGALIAELGGEGGVHGAVAAVLGVPVSITTLRN